VIRNHPKGGILEVDGCLVVEGAVFEMEDGLGSDLIPFDGLNLISGGEDVALE